jgi:hypothetical protein
VAELAFPVSALGPGCEAELSAVRSLGAGIISREELMLGCVPLVLGSVEQCCFFAMGYNLKPPPPLQHDGNAHRGSDHDDGRGRPPVRDDGREDGDDHAGKDRMPLGARRRLPVLTLTPLGHQGLNLTPWIRFGNRQSLHAGGDGAAQGSRASDSPCRSPAHRPACVIAPGRQCDNASRTPKRRPTAR